MQNLYYILYVKYLMYKINLFNVCVCVYLYVWLVY